VAELAKLIKKEGGLRSEATGPPLVARSEGKTKVTSGGPARPAGPCQARRVILIFISFYKKSKVNERKY
jgi:hypothetical protein